MDLVQEFSLQKVFFRIEFACAANPLAAEGAEARILNRTNVFALSAFQPQPHPHCRDRLASRHVAHTALTPALSNPENSRPNRHDPITCHANAFLAVLTIARLARAGREEQRGREEDPGAAEDATRPATRRKLRIGTLMNQA